MSKSSSIQFPMEMCKKQFSMEYLSILSALYRPLSLEAMLSLMKFYTMKLTLNLRLGKACRARPKLFIPLRLNMALRDKGLSQHLLHYQSPVATRSQHKCLTCSDLSQIALATLSATYQIL